ncbi:uncharacterized protein LOC110452918 [Mizuhopecten yessoensis]|nr:uncharacterized protein LOC110452918 [Mizuhopecten yessoensis]
MTTSLANATDNSLSTVMTTSTPVVTSGCPVFDINCPPGCGTYDANFCPVCDLQICPTQAPRPVTKPHTTETPCVSIFCILPCGNPPKYRKDANGCERCECA